MLSYLAAICAILLLWFVYPKDFDFGEAAGDSLLFYDAQRVGKLPSNNLVPWRHDALLYEADESRGFPDLTGGWLNGGQAGESVHQGSFSSCAEAFEPFRAYVGTSACAYGSTGDGGSRQACSLHRNN